MKNLKPLVCGTFLAMALFLVPQIALADTLPTTQQITVNGSGTITVAPNQASLSFRVRTQGKDATMAQQKNVEKMDKILSVLEQAGIPKEDIITQRYFVRPEYQYDEQDVAHLSAYVANNNFEVKTKDIKNAGNLIDLVMKAGATTSDGITFSLANSSEYYTKALELALQSAKAKADFLAQSVNGTLENPIQILEESSGPDFYQEETSLYRNARAINDEEQSSTPQIFYEDIEITAEVTATYAFTSQQ